MKYLICILAASRLLLIACAMVALFSTFADEAQANEISSCSTVIGHPNYDSRCRSSCALTDYFQFLYRSTGHLLCQTIPTSFWDYQTQVGEVSSNGKSSGGSAAASSAASSVGGNSAAAMVMTPTATITSGAMPLYYAVKAPDAEAAQVIENEMSYQDEGLPPLEKAIWIKPLGNWGAKNATGQMASIKVRAGGVMAGTDIFSNEFFRLGVLGAVNKVDVEVNENNNTIDVLALKGGVTATVEYGNWYLDGLGTYSTERTKTKRTIDINGFGNYRTLTSNFTNRRISAAFETGFRFNVGRVVVQPLAGVDINWLMQDDVTEQGNVNVAIVTAKNTIRTGTTRLGANLSTAFVVGDISIVPTVGGFWSHRFGELSGANRISTNLGASYEYVGAKPVLDVANIYTSAMINFSPNVALSTSYMASFNGFERNHAGNVGLRVRF